MDISNDIFSGRPYGGGAVLILKPIRKACQIHTYDDSRLLGITVNSSDISCSYINVICHHTNVMIIMICC